jgi:hypothetical protein
MSSTCGPRSGVPRAAFGLSAAAGETGVARSTGRTNLLTRRQLNRDILDLYLARVYLLVSYWAWLAACENGAAQRTPDRRLHLCEDKRREPAESGSSPPTMARSVATSSIRLRSRPWVSSRLRVRSLPSIQTLCPLLSNRRHDSASSPQARTVISSVHRSAPLAGPEGRSATEIVKEAAGLPLGIRRRSGSPCRRP